MLKGVISSDIDTLESLYKGYGCTGGYTGDDFRQGLENFHNFLEPFGIKATLFMVGNDFKRPENHPSIKAMAASGHEIANHSMNHIQGFRDLPPEEKEREIVQMDEICREVAGVKPVGFRAPGWNINDDAIAILKRHGYKYDSSIHPTFMVPLFKLLQWYYYRQDPSSSTKTMGKMKYMFSPGDPYMTSAKSLSKRGADGVWEFPMTVIPLLRVPFWATFNLSTGPGFFEAGLRVLKICGAPLNYAFHLSDFVDYSRTGLESQLPLGAARRYIPQSMRMPFKEKVEFFKKVVGRLCEVYEFATMKDSPLLKDIRQ